MKSLFLSVVILLCAIVSSTAQLDDGTVSFTTGSMSVHPTDGTINIGVKGTGGSLGAGASIFAYNTNAGSTAKIFVDFTTNSTWTGSIGTGNGGGSVGSLDGNKTINVPIPLLLSTNFPSRTILLGFWSTPRTPTGNTTCTVTIYNNYSIYSAVVLSGTNYVNGAGIFRNENPSNAIIRIVRGDSLHTNTVNYTLGGNAVSGTDYTGSLSGSVTILPGFSYTNITITGVPNTSMVGTKILTLTLASDANGTYQIGTNNSVTISILQDVPVVNITATAKASSPNNYYVGQFAITRTGGLTNALTANLLVGGTATAGSDYIPLPSSVNFAVGQSTTNLYVWATNASLATAKTVVLSLATNSTYFQGLTTNATVTLIPNSSSTNSVASPVGRYWRGSGSDPTYWSEVIPLEFQTGTVYSNVTGNCSNLYSGLSSWSSQPFYHYDATNALPQNSTANRIAFNNPIVAFGERTGGTPLYFGQPYSFGIYAGDVVLSNQTVTIQAYYRNNTPLVTTNSYVTTNFVWTVSTMPQNDWDGAAYGNGRFVAIGSNSGNNAAYTTNGVTWNSSTLPSPYNWGGVIYGSNKFVTLDFFSSAAAYSTNGVAWTASTLPASNNWQSITYGIGKFVAIAYNDTNLYGSTPTNVAYSANGINWTGALLPSAAGWQNVTYGNGTFVAIGGQTNGAYSTNGINWTAATLPTGNWASVAYGNGLFTAVSYGQTNAAFSTNGISWAASPPLPYAANWQSVTYGNGVFAAVAPGTNAVYSVDGTNWMASTLPVSDNWASLAYGNGMFVAPAYSSTNVAYGVYSYTTNYTYVTNYTANYQLAGTTSIYPPSPASTNAWNSYTTNEFQFTTNAFGLTTVLAGAPNLYWGQDSGGAYVLTHTASNQATNYFYVVGVSGYPADSSNPMVLNGSSQIAPSLLYSLEFEARSPWRSVFLDQPHFNGAPLPPFYAGMTLSEMLTNTPAVTNAVSFTPSAATNVDDSPELRRHPILDNFVASMNNDPIALANYVINQIGLTDPVDYNDNGNVAEGSINPGGVMRGALGTFMEKQGSPIEECALLVYLLRQAGVPAVYEYAPHNGLQMLDVRLSQMLRFQVHGDINEAGKLYTTNTMIPVNYPWVAAYIGTNWVHIFPWLKDYEMSEGLNLFDEMPTNYSNAYDWLHDYVYSATNLLSLAVNGDSTPRVVFPKFLQQTLLQNHPGVSVDDIGVKTINRPHYYARWQDFPTPTWVTNVSTPLESLSSSTITNINPTLTNIFDTMSVEIYSVTDPTKDIKTGDMRLVDLHNREFYIYQTVTNSTSVNLNMVLVPFRPGVTNQLAFGNDDTNLLAKQVLSMTLDYQDYQLGIRFKYHRHRAITPAYAVDPTTTFLGLNGDNEIDIERPLFVGQQAAICLQYGHVTRDMLNVHAADLWQMQNTLNANPALASSQSPDVYEGATMYLAGMSYYEKCNEFDQLNSGLQKFSLLSSFAAGLSKIIPGVDNFGNFTNGTDPILPCLDMFFYENMVAGNGTLHPESGQDYTMSELNFNLMEIVNDSAEEHQTINRFYQETNAVSTIRLLQLSQSRGTGIVPLTVYNYAAMGTTNYQGQPLQSWDPTMWQSVATAFQSTPSYGYVTAYITPGPITNAVFKGMGVLIFNPYLYQALISPYSLNGAFAGNNLPANTVAAANTPNYNLTANNNDYAISMTPPVNGTMLTPDNVAGLQASSTASQISGGTYAPNPFVNVAAGDASSLLGTPAGNSDSAISQDVLASEQQGNLGAPDDAGSQMATKVQDPVHNITGEYYVDETDLQLPGPIPLALRRNYSSQNLADNQFGYGWKLSIMPYLCLGKNGTNIFAADMDGAVLAYVHSTNSATTNMWFPTLAANPSLVNNTIAGVGGLANRLRDYILKSVNGSVTNYTLYGADGSVRQFQYMKVTGGAITNNRPYLLKWTDNRGNFYTFTYDTNAADASFGQMVKVQCSNGNYLDFDYDIYGHMIDSYSGDGRWMLYEYDDFGDLVTVTLPDNTTRSYQYLHSTQSVTNGGVVTQLPYSTHLIIEEDKPDGRELINAYDSQRRVTNQWSTAGSDLNPILTGTFVYSNNFVLTNVYTSTISGYTLVIDGNNHTNRYDYTSNLITKITDPLGQTTQQVWFTNTNAPGYYPRSVQQRTDKRGLVTQYLYDSNGNVTNTMVTGDLTGDGITTQTATNTAVYNTNCLPVQMTDPAGKSVQFIYDPIFNFLPQQTIRFAGATAISTNFMVYGNVTNVVINGSLLQTNFACGLLTRQVTATNSPDAATSDLTYDGHGFPTQSIRYSGTGDPNVTNTFFYNERGQMIDQVDSLGADTFTDYDALNRPIEKESFDEFGNPLSWSFTYYTDNGEVSWIDGPRYNPEDYIFYDYDGAGRRTTEIHWRSEANGTGTGVETPAGYNQYAQSFYQYDPLGNQTLAVDPRGAMTTNSFDPLCRLVQTVHLDTNGTTVLSSEQFSYEPGGLEQSHTNALGGVTSTFYTTNGLPKYRLNPDGSTNGWRYYLDGRVYREFQSNGAYWQTTYDDVNRITKRVFYSAANVPEATNSVQLDRRGNIIQKIDEGGNAFTTTYDDLNRVKIASGPAISSVDQRYPGGNPAATPYYVTNVMSQAVTNYYDAAGRVLTNINASGETTVTRMDALGRATTNLIYSATGTLVREHYTAYSADHNSITTTDGSGASAISHTTWTDTDGHTVLSIANPATGVTEFTLNQYDLAGNLATAQHDSSSGGAVTTWTTASFAYDGLNRLTSKVDRDGALTSCAYDSMGDLTNRTLTNSVQMLATFNNAGQKLQDWIVGGTSITRSNSYAYFASGSPFAGLLQTKTDGRGVTCAYAYDDRLRVTTNAYAGSLAEQNLTTTWQYEPRGYVTSYSEQFASTNTGSVTLVQRTFDPYGQLATETVNNGASSYGASQTWDATGRRTMLSVNGMNYNYAWRADGSLADAGNSTASGGYLYNTAGILTNRMAGGRNTIITSLDGEGRPLTITNTVNTMGQLGETLSWSGDGLLASHTLARPDFTDNRLYSYASLSRRLTQEQLNLNASATWTNSFVYDRGVAGGPGALTTAGPIGASFGLWWSGVADAFSRVNTETNNSIGFLAYGFVNGQSTLTAWLDSQNIQILDVGTNNMQWRTFLELSQGAHQLKVSALHPSGFFTAWATNAFTNSIPNQVAHDSYDGSGNITNRVWVNASGVTNRTQSLSFDAKGRLRQVIELNTNNYGFMWLATYDALNRRLATTTFLVSNGVPSAVPPQVLSSYYDPQVEFLELGVLLNSAPQKEFLQAGTSPSVQTVWKLYGPDLNGKYGGENGVGGLEGVSPYLNNFNPVISDARGNVLAEVTNGVASWILARPTGYGAVPGYRPVSYGNGGDFAQSCAFLGREVDVTGYHHFGLRDYDPVSGQWLSYDPSWNDRDPNGQSYCGGDPINHGDSDGRMAAAYYKNNPSQGLGGDNGTLNQYFGIVAGTQTTIQTTAHLDNGNSFALGTDNVYDPNTVLGYTAQAITTQTGQYYLYNGSQPLPDNAGQASTVQLPLGAMMEQQENTLALQYLAMVPIILDGGEALLAGAGADTGIMATRGGLIDISQHLSTVDAEGPEFAMYSRLTTAFENGRTLTGTDAAFYQHELIESSLVDSGMEQSAAHVEALSQQGIPYTPASQAALYHPSVIQQFPTSFNMATRAAAGVH